jgi:hypothetical protein
MDKNQDVLEHIPDAPAWRRRLARTIDLIAVLAVLALFLTPMIAVQAHHGSDSPLLEVSAWVYVAVFVLLAVCLGVGKVLGAREHHAYVTVGLSIMDLYPLRVGRTTRLVSRTDVPDTWIQDEKRGQAAVRVALPVFVVAVIFFVVELISFM